MKAEKARLVSDESNTLLKAVFDLIEKATLKGEYHFITEYDVHEENIATLAELGYKVYKGSIKDIDYIIVAW